MPDTLSDQSRDTGVSSSAGASRALVPLTLPSAQRLPGYRTCRADARFVAHLIATASHAPQTRTLQRAAIGDVVATYSDASARERPQVASNGLALSRVA